MQKIIINGCCGKMGTILQRVIAESGTAEVAAGIDPAFENPAAGASGFAFPCFSFPGQCHTAADCVIDFSSPAALPALLDWCVSRDLPLVTATTGISGQDRTALLAAAEQIPVFRSSNFSLGINLMTHLVSKAASVLEQEFNVEIIEKHHNQKKDSPSGTAFLLADAVNRGCQEKKNLLFGRHGKHDECRLTDMGIHAIRGGSISGEHTVLFAGSGETIEITHRALSKEIFAAGALAAALWVSPQAPGLYSMDDMLDGLCSKQ